MELETI